MEQELSDFIYQRILFSGVDEFDCYTATIFGPGPQPFEHIDGKWTLEFEPSEDTLFWKASQRGIELSRGHVVLEVHETVKKVKPLDFDVPIELAQMFLGTCLKKDCNIFSGFDFDTMEGMHFRFSKVDV